MSKAIAKAVAEATRIVIQTMAEMPSTRNTKYNRTQARWSCIKTAQFQLGSIRQIHRMEGIHSGGKKQCYLHTMPKKQIKLHDGEELVREKRAPLHRKS